MKQEVIPVALRAIRDNFDREDRLEALRKMVNVGIRLTEREIATCSTLQFGVPLAAQVGNRRLDWFEKN